MLESPRMSRGKEMFGGCHVLSLSFVLGCRVFVERVEVTGVWGWWWVVVFVEGVSCVGGVVCVHTGFWSVPLGEARSRARKSMSASPIWFSPGWPQNVCVTECMRGLG